MTSNDANSAALSREREARAAAYLRALAERDGAPDSARAEARLGLACRALEHWGDPIPGAAATASPIQSSTTPEARVAPAPRSGVVEDAVEAIAARILASDGTPESSTDTEVDVMAMRIAGAPIEGKAKRIEKGGRT